MKKILFLSLFIAMAFLKTEAQTSLISTNNSLAIDTVTDGGVRVLQTSVKGYTGTAAIQVNITKISGTLGGTLIPVASNDGVKFYAAGAGTYTVTNVASQGVLFNPPLGFKYYGVQWTGTGTMSGSFNGTLVAKRPTD